MDLKADVGEGDIFAGYVRKETVATPAVAKAAGALEMWGIAIAQAKMKGVLMGKAMEQRGSPARTKRSI